MDGSVRGGRRVRRWRGRVKGTDGQRIEPLTLEEWQRNSQGWAGFVVKTVEDLERTGPHPEPDPFLPAEPGKFRQLRGNGGWVGLLPFATQERIGLGSIQIKPVTMGRQSADQLSALLPGPHGAVESLNDAKCRCHGQFPLRWFRVRVRYPTTPNFD